MAATSQREPSWEEMLGSKDWEGLLDPLDLSLCNLILRCGDFCQATYDAFNYDQGSKYCGASRYGRSSFFEKVMLDSPRDYEVVCFLYATARVGVPEGVFLHSMSWDSWDRESNWFGYVAVTSDERTKALGRREIYVAFRGTITSLEWVVVLGAALESAKPLLGSDNDHGSNITDDSHEGPKVMLGWLSIYTADNPYSKFTKLSMRAQLSAKIRELTERYKDENPCVICTGHSLGAAEASLAAFDISENIVSDDVQVAAFLFGCPQVGNKAFDDEVQRNKNLKILHVRNILDLIPLYPGPWLGYVDTGVHFLIDTRKSPYLKDSRNFGDWHNLQAMLHTVAGWNGKDGEFKLRLKRSPALVNKSCGFLKDEYLVPESWWVEKNKGMIKNGDDEWVLAAPDEEPVPEF